MFNAFRRSLGLGICIFAAVAALAPTDDAAAQTGQGKKSKEPQSVSDMQLVQSIQTLRSARLTLEKADHDYGGHRAVAVRDITAAIHQMRLALEYVHKGKAVKGEGKKGENKKGGNEPQALSDAQLAATVPALVQTIATLKMANHDYGGHRAKAITDLETAIRQLQAALKYSQEKNQGK